VDTRPAPALDDLEPLVALGDPARRRLYEYVSRVGRTVGRDEAAAAAGMGRSLAAYHLDRLAADGLLEVSYERPEGRGGPGAGRPPKLYRRAGREFALHAPPRDYALLAEIFLRAGEGDGAARAAVERAARELGTELGRTAREAGLEEALRVRGYEPYDDGGTIRFHNCPFHALAVEHRGSVCSLNLALVEGLVAGAGGGGGVRASLEPDRAGCCVAVGPAPRKR
jgi:predicted ArsR family transcriptional regulator